MQRFTLSRRFGSALALASLALATGGCETMSPNREAAQKRWNLARSDVKARLAADQLSAGDYLEASAAAREARALAPDDADKTLLAARVELAQGDAEAAERLLDDDPTVDDRPQAAYLRGVIHEQRRQWPAALEQFERADLLEPEQLTYALARSNALLQLGRAAEALRVLTERSDQFRSAPAFQAAVAECHEQQGDWASAADTWAGLTEDDPDGAMGRRHAAALERSERWAEAARALETLLQRVPATEAPALQLRIARAQLETRDSTAAQRTLRALLEHDPRDPEALMLTVRALALQERYADAAEVAELLLEDQPRDPAALEFAASMHFRAGSGNRARRLAERLQGVDVENPIAREILSSR